MEKKSLSGTWPARMRHPPIAATPSSPASSPLIGQRSTVTTERIRMEGKHQLQNLDKNAFIGLSAFARPPRSGAASIALLY